MCYTGCCPYEKRVSHDDYICIKPRFATCWFDLPEDDEDGDECDDLYERIEHSDIWADERP